MTNQTESGAPAERLDLGAKTVIFLGGVLAALALMAINSVLPAIDTALAHGPSDSLLVKQLIGGVGLAMVVGAPLSGVVVDRIGLRKMLLGAALIYVVAGTAGLYLSDLRSLLASRLLLGVAAAAIQVSALTLINTRLEGQARAKWMGIHISVAMFGTIAVHPFAGMLGEISWRWPFVLYGFGLLLVPAAMAQVSALPKAVSAVASTPSAPAVRTAPIWKWFPFHYLPFAILIGSLVFLPSVYAPFLLREHGVSKPSIIALVLTADSIAGAGMALFYGRARKYLSAHAAFATSFAFASVGTLIVALSPNFAGIFGGLMVYGFGVGWLVPNLITSLAAKLTKERQGRGAGLVKAAHFSAAPLAVLFAEPIAREHGPVAVMFLVSGIAFVLLALIGLRTFVFNKRTASKPETQLEPEVATSA